MCPPSLYELRWVFEDMDAGFGIRDRRQWVGGSKQNFGTWNDKGQLRFVIHRSNRSDKSFGRNIFFFMRLIYLLMCASPFICSAATEKADHLHYFHVVVRTELAEPADLGERYSGNYVWFDRVFEEVHTC